MKKNLTLLFICISIYSYAQTTKIRGYVFDSNTKQPIPFVNISILDTYIGTISDTEGIFFLETTSDKDTLIFSCLGYNSLKIKINPHYFNDLVIDLVPSEISLNEVLVLPSENPAWEIMRNIIDNKKFNNPKKLKGYSYEVYNKVEIDLSNISSDISNEFIFKDIDFIFANVDTSAETGKTYLPVLIYETISDYHYQKFPKLVKEIISANLISGVENKSLSQYAGQMYIDVNIYDNFLNIFERDFVSPFSDYWRLTYKYYLLDSIYINGKHFYHLSFKPQRKQEMTFYGEFWVHDTTWAITKVKARLSDDINLNFLNDLIVQQEYIYTDSLWFLSKDEIFIDFNITENSYGVFGKKMSSRKNIVLEPDFPKNFFSLKVQDETIILDDAKDKDSIFWKNNRHSQLSNKEQNIYIMVDSVQKSKSYQIGKKIATTWITGYYVHSWWEIGPYYNFISKNLIEGRRIRFGGRTSNDFSKKFMFQGYAAYGFTDKNVKYKFSGIYMVSKSPYRKINIHYKSDYEQLGQSLYAFDEDNIVTSAFSRSAYNKILPVKELKINYKHEWFEGFSNTFQFSHRILFPTQIIEFKNIQQNIYLDRITNAEFSFDIHFAYNEKFVMGEFERYSIGCEYPVFDFSFGYGDKGILKSEFNYKRMSARFSYNFNIKPFGQIKISSEAGKIWGRVPFMLLKLHEGNETYIFDAYSFNMMNYYEFASDEYFSLYIEHHFNGFFLNKIPLIKVLKLREIIYAKSLIGSISEKNYSSSILDFPVMLSDVKKPYIELGVGLENIFKIIRIDAIWRMSYLNNPDISNFGIRFGFQFML